MRIFAVSDIHVDYPVNLKWVGNLSAFDYQEDTLILAGDVSDLVIPFTTALETLKKKFKHLMFVPGNHDLWVLRNDSTDSIQQFERVMHMATQCGASIEPLHQGSVSIIPLLGWYDYSFGKPTSDLMNIWNDFHSCRWPDHMDERAITDFFISKNNPRLEIHNKIIISFSHFLPRIDILPSFIPPERRILYPVFGTLLLDEQIKTLQSDIHIYGHHHLNLRKKIGNTLYINNAYGYPHEGMIAAKELLCIHEC